MIRPRLWALSLYFICLLPVYTFPLEVEDFEAFIISSKAEIGVWTVEYDRGHNEAHVVVDSDPLLSGGSSKVLRIAGENSSYNILKRTPSGGIAESPVFSWKWKVNRYPAGADISNLDLDDSAAQIYINMDLKCRYFWYPCILSICYFYSTTMAPGETFLWAGFGTYVKFISVRSVEVDGVGSWFLERRNVIEDYNGAVRDFLEHENRRTGKKFMQAYESALSGNSMLNLHSVAIWVDSNDTKTSAESCWDDLLFLPDDT